jgi:putative radical SAM enzyme (TIGR03279 family)
MAGLIQSVDPRGAAAQAGLRQGDALLAINGHLLRDVIDAQFYGAEGALDLAWERDGAPRQATVQRAFGQPLGIAFEHPTFDIDIRRCNNLCPFCFVLQNAPRMRRTLYIKDDDYRYSFLFGHFVTLTNLSQEDWDRLAEQRLSPLYVSVHATDVEVRRRCLRNPNAPDVLAQLRWLADHGIQTHTQLVITPGLNDGAQAEKSAFDLADLHPHVQSVSVVPVGLTRHHKYGHRPHTAAEAGAMLDAVHGWQRALKARLGVRFVHATDEWYLVCGRRVPPKSRYEGLALQENGLGMTRDFLNEWARLKRAELRPAPGAGAPAFLVPSAVLATAALFAPTLAGVAREFTALTGIRLTVAPIKNEYLGDTITVAGLLTGRDVIAQLSAMPLDPAALVILPRVMFDHPDGIALDDMSPMDIARALGRTVALADWMGDVLDALAGRNKLTFDPRAPDASAPVARDGGWAVEKYL